ncbi:sensor histidine kinase [Virgisporangium ochraceum]|uniref:histidine kinase n=1 Tax=Virgisporangium ochraceum TaxID=65505 RepID=A0A8J3ZYE7_9ACTN|nr:histidine kinase [Virgisporangium ochraceum]GIJ69755.1 hypothetical protein Voc01_046720 [Virgisporangium ochraceum]
MPPILRRLPWPDLALVAGLAVAVVLFEVFSPDFLREVGGDAPAAPVGPGPVREPDGCCRTVDDRSWGLLLLATALITGPLVVRRRWPLVCFAVQYPALLAAQAASNVPALLAVLVGAYSVAAYLPAVLSMGVLVGTAAVTASIESETWPRVPGTAGVFVILVPIGLTGIAIRAARGRAEASQQRAAALEREQSAATRLALELERARIARELHDVVSHHVSVMTIQAGAAGKVLDQRPELARIALAAIEDSGRETMAELRHLLGALAPGAAQVDEDLLHPQPGLAQLDALVATVRQAGQPVSLSTTEVELSRGMDLAAYRVVQEALTNALRHAPGARTRVELTVDEADLVIDVTNDEAPAPPAGRPASEPPGTRAGSEARGSMAGWEGRENMAGSEMPAARAGSEVPDDRAGAEAATNGSGSGLLGLAERLRLYHGVLETGRRPGGGFRVRARLPMEEL